jgi:circadian clock protein KaiC
MTVSGKVPIPCLRTGVPGLDDVLGGEGLPEYSFNLIAGPPGSGKTTLAQQIMFANATPERPALFFTVLGEPTLKMMRYMQQLSFFDMEKVGTAVRFLNLSDEALTQELDSVLERIVGEVNATHPAIVIVDSFRTTLRSHKPDHQVLHVEGFVQRLAQHLTSWQATTFLVGEYGQDETEDNPVFTVADSLIWLWQSVERNSVVRKLRIGKMRGRAPTPGQHTFRITEHGVRVFSRKSNSAVEVPRRADIAAPARQSLGVPVLDQMAHGGVPTGSSILVAGPAGCGKTVLASHFIAAGLAHDEPAVIAVFEEHPDEYVRRADAFGFQLTRGVTDRRLTVLGSRPLDLSVDETLYDIQKAVDALGARRVVIDSLSGLELAAAPTFQQEYRESLYRVVGQLTRQGITVLMTCEVVESFADLKFTPHAISFLTDMIIVQRYIELEGRLQRMISVVKMRQGPHSNELRTYEIASGGIVLGETLSRYRGIVTGVPQRTEPPRPDSHWGLEEVIVLQALVAFGPSTVETLARQLDVGQPQLEAATTRLVAMGCLQEQRTTQGEKVYRIGPLS